jgi:predicted GNAT family acetyltransferase
MPTVPSALADLRSRWDKLHDLDRAKEVHDIKRTGVSTREIALQLPVSEALLRHLLQAAQAPTEDQLLARQGKISTNELIRRAKAAKARRAVEQSQALNLKRAEASIKASKTICDWLRSQGVPSNLGQQIVDEARRRLIEAEQNKRFPPGAVPPGTPVAEIIRRSRPPQAKTNDVDQIAWRAFWLAVWVYRAWPDDWVRYRAIEMALEEQLRKVGRKQL